MLYKNKYRIESTRFKNWDYSSDGCYFVTICTQDRNYYFGTINHCKMVLSDMGEIANWFWREIPNHFPFVRLDKWVIMPNHVHGIVVIDKSKIVETPKLGVSTATATGSNAGIKNHWKPGNIGVIVNQYKRICTIQSRKINPGFAWQPRFHDHIVRNNDELNRIREYITNNPANWANDDLQFQNGNNR